MRGGGVRTHQSDPFRSSIPDDLGGRHIAYDIVQVFEREVQVRNARLAAPLPHSPGGLRPDVLVAVGKSSMASTFQ